MKRIVNKMKENNKYRVRLLVSFVIIIFMPLLVNVIYINKRTEIIVKNQKIRDLRTFMRREVLSVNEKFKSLDSTINELLRSGIISNTIPRYDDYEYISLERDVENFDKMSKFGLKYSMIKRIQRRNFPEMTLKDEESRITMGGMFWIFNTKSEGMLDSSSFFGQELDKEKQMKTNSFKKLYSKNERGNIYEFKPEIYLKKIDFVGEKLVEIQNYMLSNYEKDEDGSSGYIYDLSEDEREKRSEKYQNKIKSHLKEEESFNIEDYIMVSSNIVAEDVGITKSSIERRMLIEQAKAEQRFKTFGVVHMLFSKYDLREQLNIKKANEEGIKLYFYDNNKNYLEWYKADESIEYIMPDTTEIVFEDDRYNEFVKDGEKFGYIVKKTDLFDGYIIGVRSMANLMGDVKDSLNDSFAIILVISLIVTAIILVESLMVSKILVEKEVASYRLNITEEMNDKLRMHKHDFSNHLQVIHGLVSMDKNDRTIEYINNLIKEGRKTHANYKIGIPEFEAAISTAIKQCKNKDIEVEIDVEEIKELDVNIYDITKAFTNLIKNAIYALNDSKDKDKKLSIMIYKEFDMCYIEVVNSTPEIPEEIRDKIFEKGFTTKGKNGSGLGLHMVKNLVEKNKGQLELIVEDSGNHFIMSFEIEES